uniref:Uncharacterized protein n=1 Tax=Panagrolaimus sp. ES5 TaxID=591445 RepID=A0AC34FN53_9BILA
MGLQLFVLSSILLLLLTTFPCFIEAETIKCESFKAFTPISNWTLESVRNLPEGDSITCVDACAGYLCVVNGSVIKGAGCYSDFKATCTGSTSATNIDVGEKSFEYKTKMERGNFVFACKWKKSMENCATQPTVRPSGLVDEVWF